MISIEVLHTTIPATASMEDPIVLAMLARAIAFVQSETRRYFGPPVTLTDYLPGFGNRVLRLPEPKTISDSDDDDGGVDLIEERSYPGGPATIIGIDAYDLRHEEKDDVLVRLGGGVWCRGFEYAVTYRRGYEDDAGPKDIEALLLGLLEFKLAFADKTGLRSESIGGYSFTRFGDSDLDAIDGARETIANWRRAVFA